MPKDLKFRYIWSHWLWLNYCFVILVVPGLLNFRFQNGGRDEGEADQDTARHNLLKRLLQQSAFAFEAETETENKIIF